MSLGDAILAEAARQLDKSSKAITDGSWFDTLIAELKAKAIALPPNDATAMATIAAINAVEQQKSKVVGLGSSAFALFLDKLAVGDEQGAASIYLRAAGSADDIIEAMERGTLGVLEAKRALDKIWADAWEIVKSVAITGAKLLLPLVLAAL